MWYWKLSVSVTLNPLWLIKQIKQKTSVLMIPTYTVTSISARPIGLDVMLVIVPVSTFRTDVIYLWNEPMSIIRNTVREMKIWIYWSESNSWIYFYIYLNKNWKIYWFWTKFYWFWAGGPVLIMRTVTSIYMCSFNLVAQSYFFSILQGKNNVNVIFCLSSNFPVDQLTTCFRIVGHNIGWGSLHCTLNSNWLSRKTLSHLFLRYTCSTFHCWHAVHGLTLYLWLAVA